MVSEKAELPNIFHILNIYRSINYDQGTSINKRLGGKKRITKHGHLGIGGYDKIYPGAHKK